MKVSERLYNSIIDLWDKYNEHPFVKGLGRRHAAAGKIPVLYDSGSSVPDAVRKGFCAGRSQSKK